VVGRGGAVAKYNKFSKIAKETSLAAVKKKNITA
jgi:hypothetical protein